jgi:hypothetical protein
MRNSDANDVESLSPLSHNIDEERTRVLLMKWILLLVTMGGLWNLWTLFTM